MLTRDITERKRAEERLRKLSRAVEQSPASAVITNLQGEIEYVNPEFTQLTGYTSEEAIGQNPRILKSGVQAETTYRELWKTLLSGSEWRGEFANKKKNAELALIQAEEKYRSLIFTLCRLDSRFHGPYRLYQP
jgi:PAS domain S-box-containing protein